MASLNGETAVVTGATGAIGPVVVRALLGSGFRVRTFSLDAPQPGDLPAGVEIIRGDITDAVAVDIALRGAHVLIHMAALLHIDNPPPALRSRYHDINVEGTRCVTHLARHHGIRRIVFFSTINVYGPTNGNLVDEEAPLRADTFYAETKREGEQIVLSAEGQDGRKLATVLRLAAVYGARVKGNYRRLARALGKGRGVALAGRNRRTLVYDQDVGRAVVSVLESPNSAGKVYNVTDGTTHTVQDIFRAIRVAAGLPAPKFFLPLFPLQVTGTLGRRLLKAVRLPIPTSLVLLEKYLEDIAVNGSRIQNETSFKPIYDLERGWRETIRLMRKAGEL